MQTWRDATTTERQKYQAIALIFAQHTNLLEFFFDQSEPRISFEPGCLLKAAECFSSGERQLIRVALDVWSSSGNAKIWQILETLDSVNFSNVLEALVLWRSYKDT